MRDIAHVPLTLFLHPCILDQDPQRITKMQRKFINSGTFLLVSLLFPTLQTSAIYCAAGSYSHDYGSNIFECNQCGTGKYQPIFQNIASCIDAPAGYEAVDGTHLVCARTHYAEANNPLQCIVIPSGYTCTSEGIIDCKAVVACPVGWYGRVATLYGGGPLAAGCVICSAGTSSAAGSTSCFTCTSGTYSIAGSLCCALGRTALNPTTCVPCPAGTKGNTGAQCTDCPSGQWGGMQGATTCSQCAAGNYTSVPGAAACLQCSPGSYSVAPGATACESCAINTFSPGGLASCVSCSKEFYSPSGSVACLVCATGSTSISGSGCTLCPAGYYSVGGSGCSTCPGGFSSISGQLCIECSAGETSAAGGLCTPCAAGTDSLGGGTCLPCGAGYSSLPGLRCLPCTPGWFNSIIGGICTRCELGTVSSNSAATSCVNCNATLKQYSNSIGQVSCAVCDLGSFTTWFPLRSDRCLACPQGSRCDGTPRVTHCNNGTYQSEVGMSSCTTCSANSQYSPASNVGAIVCRTCSVGYYVSQSRTLCTVCPAGYKCDGEQRLVCDSGTFSNAIGSSECTTCTDQPTGYTLVDGLPHTFCSVCPPGMRITSMITFNNHQTCVSCLPGFSCDGTTLAIPCSGGFYAPLSGSIACLSCPTGKFTALRQLIGSPATLQLLARTSCDSCQPGQFVNHLQTRCEDCMPHTVCPDGAMAVPCNNGTFAAPSISRTVCQRCEHLTYTPLVLWSSTSTVDEILLAGFANCLTCDKQGAYVAGGTACTVCEPGYVCFDGERSACHSGTYAPLYGAYECLQCTGNTFAANDNLPHSSCTACPGGTVSNTHHSACLSISISNSSNISALLKGESSSSSHSSSSSSSSHSSSSSSSSHSSSSSSSSHSSSSSSSSHSSSSSSSSSSVFPCPVGIMLGCIVLDPVYGQHNYSSVLLNRAADFGRGRLMESGAWAPSGIGTAHYMQLDLLFRRFVVGIAIRGKPGKNQWTTAVRVQTSMDGVSFDASNVIIAANTNDSSIAYRLLNERTSARFVRLSPVNFHPQGTWPHMAAGIMVASAPFGASAVVAELPGKMFLLYTDVKTWQNAENYCVTQTGGHLATVWSATDNQAIRNVLAQGAEAWIGYGDPDETYKMAWADQSLSPYIGVGWTGNSLCAKLIGGTSSLSWGRASCIATKSFVCMVCNNALLTTNRNCQSCAVGTYFNVGVCLPCSLGYRCPGDLSSYKVSSSSSSHSSSSSSSSSSRSSSSSSSSSHSSSSSSSSHSSSSSSSSHSSSSSSSSKVVMSVNGNTCNRTLLAAPAYTSPPGTATTTPVVLLNNRLIIEMTIVVPSGAVSPSTIFYIHGISSSLGLIVLWKVCNDAQN